MTIIELQERFPTIGKTELNFAIKYQEKFSLTLENLKCLNPDCNNIRKLFNSKWGFGHTCGNNICKEKTKKQVIAIGLKKHKENYLAKTGYEHPGQNPEVQQKMKETYLSKTGYTNPGQNPEVQQKMKDTCLKKYGVEYSSQNPETRIKAKETQIERYGNNINTHYKNNHITNFEHWYDKQFWIDNFMVGGIFDNYKCMEYFNCSYDTINLKIIELEIERKKTKSYSKAEQDLFNYLESFNTEIIRNSQQIIKPKEIDLFLPEYNIAIEYNGIYWHSYMKQGSGQGEKQTNLYYAKNRHFNKTKECEEKGIQLFHIFETEWLDPIKQKIWKSVFQNALNKSEKIGARKCIIKRVPKKEIRPFLEQNHLQGYGSSPIAYGLYYKDELYSIMTFTKGSGRMDNKADWELIRFCNKIGFNIQGAASRLLKAFRKDHPGSIKSYANRRWSQGGLYRQLGFLEQKPSDPNFFVWHLNNYKKMYPRQTFQKHKLENILDIYDKDKTAIENVINNNYAIIWDAGNFNFILN